MIDNMVDLKDCMDQGLPMILDRLNINNNTRLGQAPVRLLC